MRLPAVGNRLVSNRQNSPLGGKLAGESHGVVDGRPQRTQIALAVKRCPASGLTRSESAGAILRNAERPTPCHRKALATMALKTR
jgi:hypothetical protein